jgi:hypothetical protein
MKIQGIVGPLNHQMELKNLLDVADGWEQQHKKLWRYKIHLKQAQRFFKPVLQSALSKLSAINYKAL